MPRILQPSLRENSTAVRGLEAKALKRSRSAAAPRTAAPWYLRPELQNIVCRPLPSCFLLHKDDCDYALLRTP